jgi:hypothetical protein
MGEKLQISLTRKNGSPIAAILTLQHRSSVVYKYGCSDEKFHNIGGMPFLFWRLIEQSKALGAERIDFGRTDLDNQGLIIFKDRLGSTRKLLTYYRYGKSAREGVPVSSLRDSRAVQRLVSLLPAVISSAASRVLYRHIG